MIEPLRVRPLRWIDGLAAPGPDGPILVTGRDGRDRERSAVAAVDLSGRVRWRRELPGGPRPPRVDREGTVWVHRRGRRGPELRGLDPAGGAAARVRPEHETGERLAAFVVMPDGFCAIWLPRGPAARAARVARHGADGAARWSAPLVPGPLSYPGVGETSRESGWRRRPAPPWEAAAVEVGLAAPLLVSGDRVAAALWDAGSGIGVTFFLDAATGRPTGATEPAPAGLNAVAGPGRFLVGSQGYGAFSTALHDGSGVPVRAWPSHVMPLVGRDGGIRGPESEDGQGARFAVLEPGGAVRRGPALAGHGTADPALDRDGTAVLWRAGRLLAVSAELEARELHAGAGEEEAVARRILLLAEGRVALALGGELLIFPGTGLGPLDTGPWPCADGGLRGNPVACL
ncbi:hypothetical protein [Bailinhaonella thermotolerans]|uniref:Uncharacterized protein n=1 Tax=Bailinhaonella thermotolerans TaxID=1070861 RepID=A0A3A4ACV9_9ACTN|nr:hypothetical protein [Bailinhaonella thermotolerans]RJL27136.1 hypothetical protein D5H75_25345 [Bailinhaonella thermotolerans]